MKRISIRVAREVAKEVGARQVILLVWDGKLTHIVTYGKSEDDCAQAATGGNMLKQKWGWPECNDQPSRVRVLEKKIGALLALLEGKQCRAARPVGDGVTEHCWMLADHNGKHTNHEGEQWE